MGRRLEVALLVFAEQLGTVELILMIRLCLSVRLSCCLVSPEPGAGGCDSPCREKQAVRSGSDGALRLGRG